MKIQVGADPEVFCSKEGELVSAHGLIKGDKKNPHPVENGAVQVDGMALEFNIDPASSEEAFIFNMKDVLRQLDEMIEGHTLEIRPVAHFGTKLIESQPQEAKVLGCDPDYNAWVSKENHPPDAELPFRTAAGHLHIGWTDGANIKDGGFLHMVEELVKQLDFFLGLPSLIFDGDTQRREMYGKAGAYRPKPYGVEYRTLSNQWLKSEGHMRLVYKNIQDAMQRMFKGNKLADKWGDIQNIINTSDVNRAKEIMNQEGICYDV